MFRMGAMHMTEAQKIFVCWDWRETVDATRGVIFPNSKYDIRIGIKYILTVISSLGRISKVVPHSQVPCCCKAWRSG